MGNKGEWEEVKSHPFFSTIDWEEVALRRKTGPLMPSLSCTYFDKEYLDDLSDETIKKFQAVNNRTALSLIPKKGQKV